MTQTKLLLVTVSRRHTKRFNSPFWCKTKSRLLPRVLPDSAIRTKTPIPRTDAGAGATTRNFRETLKHFSGGIIYQGGIRNRHAPLALIINTLNGKMFSTNVTTGSPRAGQDDKDLHSHVSYLQASRGYASGSLSSSTPATRQT